jgi:hypothetical protein
MCAYMLCVSGMTIMCLQLLIELLMTWKISAFQVNVTSMMTQTLQGKVMAYTPSSFPVQQQILPEDLEMLQLDNMDQGTSPVRAVIIKRM